ncbi:MAG: putative metalloprotease with PDZ domain, partial [Candidatus Paceibacteria bacterium]
MCTRNINGKTAEFGTTGYTMGNVFVLYDRTSDSIWYPQTDSTIDAVAGSEQGTALEILDEPAPMALVDWLATHPDSSILLPGAEDIARRNRARLGVQLGEAESGVLIAGVGEGTAAGLAGIQQGDLIVAINEAQITNPGDLRNTL